MHERSFTVTDAAWLQDVCAPLDSVPTIYYAPHTIPLPPLTLPVPDLADRPILVALADGFTTEGYMQPMDRAISVATILSQSTRHLFHHWWYAYACITDEEGCACQSLEERERLKAHRLAWAKVLLLSLMAVRHSEVLA